MSAPTHVNVMKKKHTHILNISTRNGFVEIISLLRIEHVLFCQQILSTPIFILFYKPHTNKLLKLTKYIRRLLSVWLLSVMFLHAYISLAICNVGCWCWQFVDANMSIDRNKHLLCGVNILQKHIVFEPFPFCMMCSVKFC